MPGMTGKNGGSFVRYDSAGNIYYSDGSVWNEGSSSWLPAAGQPNSPEQNTGVAPQPGSPNYTGVQEASDADEKARQAAILASNYATASNSLNSQWQADAANQNRLAPFQQRRLMGNVASRGLGRSYMGNVTKTQAPGSSFMSMWNQAPSTVNTKSGGYGSGMMTELLGNQASQMGSLNSGYEGLQNELSRQQSTDNIDLNSFFDSLSRQRLINQQQQNANTPSIFDYLGTATSMASLF
jgi:hypothetical protein